MIMKNIFRFAFALLFLFAADFVHACCWTFVDLDPGPGFPQSGIFAVNATYQYGFALDSNSVTHASRWQGSPGSWFSLGLGNIVATTGSAQVGNTIQNGQFAAAKWSSGGMTLLPVPAGATSSIAFGMYSVLVVGSFVDANGTKHAILWGKHSSITDLHLAGLVSSEAFAVGYQVQAGQFCFSTPSTTDCHAAIWHNSAGSMIDAHPMGYQNSFIRGIQGDIGVGSATLPSGQTHAGFWYLPSAGFNDVHDAFIPALNSSALNAYHNGWGVGSKTFFMGDPDHAAVFDFNTGEVTDLHFILPPDQFTMSNAFAIWHPSTGTTFVGGFAQHATDGRLHPILWIRN